MRKVTEKERIENCVKSLKEEIVKAKKKLLQMEIILELLEKILKKIENGEATENDVEQSSNLFNTFNSDSMI